MGSTLRAPRPSRSAEILTPDGGVTLESRDHGLLVEQWSAHAREVFDHYGFAAPPEAVRALAERIADESIAHLEEWDRAKDRYREQQRTRATICAEIATGRSRAEAAQLAGVSVETLRRWQREDPSFRIALATAMRERRSQQADRRPFKMTPSVRRMLLQRLSDGMTRAQAAASVGVSRQTFYAWLRKVPEFAVAVASAEDAAAAARASG
jgi:DNA-binding XRE family transcriptional regulator